MKSPKNKPQKVLTLKKLLKVVNPIKKSAPDSYPTGKPKYPNAYSKLSTMKPSPQKKVVKEYHLIEVYVDGIKALKEMVLLKVGATVAIKFKVGALPSVNKKNKS